MTVRSHDNVKANGGIDLCTALERGCSLCLHMIGTIVFAAATGSDFAR